MRHSQKNPPLDRTNHTENKIKNKKSWIENYPKTLKYKYVPYFQKTYFSRRM